MRARPPASRAAFSTPCELYTSDTTGNLRSMIHDGKPTGPSGDLKIGDLWAIGEGPILAGQFVPSNGKALPLETDADGQPLFKVGRIWGGAKVVRTRPYFILPEPRRPEPAHGLQHRRAVERHLPRDLRAESEGRRRQDARADPHATSRTLTGTTTTASCSSPGRCRSCPRRRPALSPEARGRTARPGQDARGRGETRSARRQ